LVRVFKNLKPKLQGTTIEVNGDLNRPPMERTEQIAALYEKARGIAVKLGFDLPEAAVGGGSDGNFTAALGIPTLDGLGCLGDGPHAEYEHVVIDSLPLRSALVAHLLLEV
jgi:glutamate carboxypeptidase